MEAQGTVEKAVDVLFHLHAARSAQGVTAIGRALDLPKSSAHRLLASLGRRGLVERDDRGRYRPGIGLVALGLGALDADPLAVAGRSVLADGAAQLGETLFLVAPRRGELTVVAKAEGTGVLRAAPAVGSVVPVHATAVGKLFLAFGEGQVRAPRGPLTRFTEGTLGARRELAREVESARERGYAESREEWIAGLCAAAAPIFARGELVAAVAVALPSARLGELGSGAVVACARGAADRIGARLEGRVPDLPAGSGPP